jgi:ATP-binding protein involved in chromosome partitioning
MSVTKPAVLERLRRVMGPDLESNIVDLGLVSEILIKDARVYFSITVPAARAVELEPLRQAAEKMVSDLEGVSGVTAVLTAEATRGSATSSMPPANVSTIAEHKRVKEAREKGMTGDGAGARSVPSAPGLSTGAAQQNKIAGVKHLVAVASGKGGVGKSTTAVNLALGFKALGLKAGILDADIYGPSQPRLLGISGKPETTGSGKTLRPMKAYGLKTMSMGFLVDEGTPIIFRGPMVVSALNQMLRDTAWDEGDGGLDVLVIDMPPGTGDVQLTMAQQVPLSGAVIVSTPQDLALIDARKGLNMFRKVDVPVLGIIENMSTFVCPKCGERSDIFGHGGAKLEAEKLEVPFLGGVPLHIDIRATSDSGRPITATEPDGVHAQIYRELAAKVWAGVLAGTGKSVAPPTLSTNTAGDVLTVAFADGETHQLSAEMLRVMSPSAEVQGHSPEQRVTLGKKRAVKIKELLPVGNYAVKIAFDDGHNTGLYAWNYLDTLGREKETRWATYLAELEAKGLSRG